MQFRGADRPSDESGRGPVQDGGIGCHVDPQRITGYQGCNDLMFGNIQSAVGGTHSGGKLSIEHIAHIIISDDLLFQ